MPMLEAGGYASGRQGSGRCWERIFRWTGVVESTQLTRNRRQSMPRQYNSRIGKFAGPALLTLSGTPQDVFHEESTKPQKQQSAQLLRRNDGKRLHHGDHSHPDEYRERKAAIVDKHAEQFGQHRA